MRNLSFYNSSFPFNNLKDVRLALAVFLLIVPLLSGTACGATLTTESYANRLVTVELYDKDLMQVLSAISDQVGIKIIFSGKQPTMKTDIKMVGVTFENAINNVLHNYEVKNHTIVYNTTENAIERIELHVYAGNYVSPEAITNLDQKMEPLSAQSDHIEEKMRMSEIPLSQEQMARDSEKSDHIKAEMEKGTLPLTKEQMAKDKEKSDRIKAEMEKETLPLTKEQMAKDKEKSDRIKAEME